MSEKRQEQLRGIYGEGNYLLNSDLTWNEDVSFQTDALFNAEARDNDFLKLDTYNTQHGIDHGASHASLGIINIDDPLLLGGYAGADLFMVAIKEPGTDVHKIPDQLMPLQPVFKSAAQHQFQYSKYAYNKYCLAMIRYLPLLEDQRQITQEQPHCHLGGDVYGERYIQAFDDNGADASEIRRILNNKAHAMTLNDYNWSNTCPTAQQIHQTDKPIDTLTKMIHVRATKQNTTQIPFRQVLPMELTVANGIIYHEASVPDDEEYGQKRMLLLISYAFSHAAQHFYMQDNGYEDLPETLTLKGFQ